MKHRQITKLYLVLFAFTCLLLAESAFSQEEDDWLEYEIPKTRGIAVDVFPLINSIFSDDGSSDLFELTYLWGKRNSHHEFSLSPSYSRLKADEAQNFEQVNDQTNLGISVQLFHGNKFDIGKRWIGMAGFTYRYSFSSLRSKLSFSQDAKLITESHSGGLGGQFMFGYKFSDHVWIRSKLAGLVQYSETSTKISDSQINVTEQSSDRISFDLLTPSVIELVFIFNRKTK